MMGRGEFAELGGGSGAGSYEPGIGDFWDDVGDFASDAVSTIAPIALAAVGTVIAPGLGTALGGALGTAISKGVGGGVGGPLGAAIQLGGGILTGDVTGIVKGGVSLTGQAASSFGGGGGGGGGGATEPPPQQAHPVPGIDNLFGGGWFPYFRGGGNVGPITIHVAGWTLDTAASQWVKGGTRLAARNGDRNLVTGETFPPAAPMMYLGDILKNLRQVLPPQPQQMLAAPQEAHAAPPWSTTKKVVGVGAVAGLGYLAWRIANM
jgi:hypothetical protein